MGSTKRSQNDLAYISKNQKYFFKSFLKGVTAKLNKKALYGVLADLKKIYFCLEINYLSKKKNRLS
jgi:hypothetical protein